MAPENTNPEPPVPKYSHDEFWDIVDERWMRDCKEDACFDKYLVEVHDSIGRKHLDSSRYSFLVERSYDDDPSIYDHPPFSNFEGCESMQQALFSDLESLLPGYFSEFSPSASTQEKFDPLREKIKKRFKAWYRTDHVDDPFETNLLRSLAKKNFRDFVDSRKDDGVATLSDQSLTEVLKQLTDSIQGEQERASFSCGGTVAITPNAQDPGASDVPPDFRNSPPITIYWAEENGQLQKVSLPHESSDKDGHNSLENLVGSCIPATFGRGNEDVLDTSYRSAGAIGPDRFCTSFHPADFGIINAIEQLLLPNIDSQAGNQFEFRRVKAELYKLNIYSAPSGIFRRHVDTPRSTSQFGSLVVCLPSPHKGGHLEVSHNGGSVKFDWSHLSSSNIQWAAFYSDCEHEISRVSQGHRITLTYNLYITEPIGGPLIQNSVVSATGFPLYGQLQDALENPGFLKEGGALGFFCSHSYPHSSSAAGFSLPKGLKGVDMGVFSVLKSLGLQVKVLPILEEDDGFLSGTRKLHVRRLTRNGGEGEHRLYYDPDDSHERRFLDRFRISGEMFKNKYFPSGCCEEVRSDFYLDYQHFFEDFTNTKDLKSYWKFLLMARYPKGTPRPHGARVGHSLYPYDVVDPEDEEEYWSSYFVPGVTWLTSPKYQQRAFTHLVYGNEAETDTKYSYAAIIAVVPGFQERNFVTISEEVKGSPTPKPASD